MPTTNFPTSLDDNSSLPNPGSGSFTNNPSHAGQHDIINDAVKAIEAKLGIGSGTPVANRVFRGTGTGTSAWAQLVLTTDVTGTLPVANGGTGGTTSTGSGAVVLTSSPTIVTPTITSFVNATHDHTNAAGGGQLPYGALLSTIFSGQINTYTNTGSAGGTIKWVNIGGIKFIWGIGMATNTGAWNVVDLLPVGLANIPSVTANTITQGSTPPGGWVEFTSKSSPATGAPEAGGFSILNRNAAGNNNSFINFFAIGT